MPAREKLANGHVDSSTTITATGDTASGTPRRRGGPLEPGALVGRYVVLAKVGSGGMGIVYAAYDPELDRKVALKLLHADDPGEVRARRQTRLLREAQAMAKLDHPNVVTVHDVGAHRDQVYIALEFVEGCTLTEWCRRYLPGWRESLGVFVEAARGLQAAHERGLVHRDFKPDNVMVGEESGRGATPRVRVMDFGLAHATPSAGDDSLANLGAPESTHQGLAGTPKYMAPEAIRREPVEAAADQFSFCVALWEVLYGQHPFPGDTPAELAGNVAAGNLRSPTSRRAVPGWLRRACIRGLSRDPAQRFASMHELIAVLERGPARAWRIRGLGLLGVLAVAGVGVAWAQHHRRMQLVAACDADGAAIARVWGDARRLELRERIVASGAADADATADRVMPWLDSHAQQWADARSAACMSGHDDPDWDADRLDRSMWCLDDCKRELDALVTTLAGGDANSMLRAVQAAAGLTPVSLCLDVDFARRLPAPSASDRDGVAAVHDELFRADALYGTGAYDDALEVARAALARAQEMSWPPLVAASRMRVGNVLEETGAYAEAERSLEEAYFEAVHAGAIDLAVATAQSLAFTVGYRLQRSNEGMRWWKQADALDRDLPDPSGLRRGRSLASLAMLHRAGGEWTTAREVGLRALGLVEAALGPEHPELAGIVMGLGNSARNLGEHAQARQDYERALSICERALGPQHPDVAALLDSLGGVAQDTDDFGLAMRLRERALEIRERALGPAHPDVGLTLGQLASAYSARGDHARALAMSERALAIQEAALGPEDLDVARALVNLAAIHRAAGDNATSLPRLERALRIAEAKLGPDHPELAHPLIALAEALLVGGERARARVMFERAKALVDGSGGNSGLAVSFLEPLAELALAEGRPTDAIELAERAVLLERSGHISPIRLAAVRFLLAQALADAGRDPKRARTLAEQARATYVEAGDRASNLRMIDSWLAAH